MPDSPRTEEGPRGGLPVRRAVSVAVFAPGDPTRVLTVRRPPDDADLPDTWGLPAVRVAPGEDPRDAAVRVGREKLGVELRPLDVLRSGSVLRPAYRLEMDLVRAEIAAGTPSVPRPSPAGGGSGSTQYTEWAWAPGRVLAPAREKGSLCCRLFLEWDELEGDELEGDELEGGEDRERGSGKHPADGWRSP